MGKFAIEEESNGLGEISIIHSFAHALCTVLLVLRTQVAFGVGIGGNIYFCVVKYLRIAPDSRNSQT